VVAVVFTVNVPLGEMDWNVPGVMAMLLAPVVAQFSLAEAPVIMLAGTAVKELMVGLDAAKHAAELATAMETRSVIDTVTLARWHTARRIRVVTEEEMERIVPFPRIPEVQSSGPTLFRNCYSTQARRTEARSRSPLKGWAQSHRYWPKDKLNRRSQK
jgi:hypothetical protein